MLILAKTHAGTEFMYNAKSAHAVSKRSAEKILEIINKNAFQIDPAKGEKWFMYEVDHYDPAPYTYAQYQRFTIRNGIVTARSY